MRTVLPFATLARENRKILSKDRRRWRRVALRLKLKFLTEDGFEKTGTTINISGSGLLFHTNAPPFRGERLICYIDGLGRISGHVVRSTAGQVALKSDAPFVKRDRLVDQLIWLANKDELKLDEERRAARNSTTGQVLVQTQDGRELRCHVIDMSLVGVALAMTGQPPLIGERVQVGAKQGVVARYFAEGFAVDFTSQL